MQKTIGTEYKDKEERIVFLTDNCDEIVEKNYMKSFSEEEIDYFKDELAEVSIKIKEVEKEKKETIDIFKTQLKPLYIKHLKLIANIKDGADYVYEEVYKFVARNEKQTGYYNDCGNLIEQREATEAELQPTIFMNPILTGTNN